MRKIVIVNVNLQYEFDVDTDEQAIEAVENVELPKEYVEDSFELVRVIHHICSMCNQEEDEDGRCGCVNEDAF